MLTARHAPTPSGRDQHVGRPRPTASAIAPGLAVVAVCVAVALVAAGRLEPLSPLVVAAVLGAIVANLGVLPAAAAPGIAFSGRTLLRGGVALLGFQLSVGDVVSLGIGELAMVVAVVVTTFATTRWLGRRLGLSDDLSLLVATGYSICGASAIAAMDDVAHADEEDVAVAIALVTLCGTLAIGVLPLLRGPVGLGDPTMFGSWVGASVHDVGQVVATASGGGATALHTAVLVKLTRVIMLAPLVVFVSSRMRRGAASASGATASVVAARPKLVPTFLVGFLGAIVLRSTGLVPAAVLGGIRHVQLVLLAAGLFALGAGVRIAKLRTVGPRPFVLGLGSWIVIGLVSYVGVLATHPA
ncbi:MAG: putative sulfate exporter family transporter [Ilumatobacteraceae bacterium]